MVLGLITAQVVHNIVGISAAQKDTVSRAAQAAQPWCSRACTNTCPTEINPTQSRNRKEEETVGYLMEGIQKDQTASSMHVTSGY